MIYLNPELEIIFVVTSVMTMLSIAAWPFFRRQANKKNSQSVKLMASATEIDNPESGPPFPPSVKREPSKYLSTFHDHGAKFFPKA